MKWNMKLDKTLCRNENLNFGKCASNPLWWKFIWINFLSCRMHFLSNSPEPSPASDGVSLIYLTWLWSWNSNDSWNVKAFMLTMKLNNYDLQNNPRSLLEDVLFQFDVVQEPLTNESLHKDLRQRRKKHIRFAMCNSFKLDCHNSQLIVPKIVKLRINID